MHTCIDPSLSIHAYMHTYIMSLLTPVHVTNIMSCHVFHSILHVLVVDHLIRGMTTSCPLPGPPARCPSFGWRRRQWPHPRQKRKPRPQRATSGGACRLGGILPEVSRSADTVLVLESSQYMQEHLLLLLLLLLLLRARSHLSVHCVSFELSFLLLGVLLVHYVSFE